MGAPGSGKGTYGKRLAKDLNVPYVETGAIIRSILKDDKDSELKSQIKTTVEKGELISDQLAFSLIKTNLEKVVKQYISEQGYCGGYIMDGFPRNIYQFEMIQTM